MLGWALGTFLVSCHVTGLAEESFGSQSGPLKAAAAGQLPTTYPGSGESRGLKQTIFLPALRTSLGELPWWGSG